MIALTDAIRKGSLGAYFRAERGESSDSSRHGIVSGITIQPLFRQPPAALDCEISALRWPGSFGFGFLSPQPPGIVGTGPSAANKGQRELALLFCALLNRDTKLRRSATGAIRLASDDVSLGVSAATCRPRPAWDRACRDCRPEPRP